MATVAGRVRIAAPVELVFDTAADSRNEPGFNPAMARVDLLTAEPVGLGSRFRARMSNGMDLVVELTAFDRPHRIESVTKSSIMETSGALTFSSDGRAALMSWAWQVRPKGWFRLLGPLVGPLGRGRERRVWAAMKHQLEHAAPPS